MSQRRTSITVPAPRAKPRRREAAGFTLIELSIVLVIIGLLVGGVAAGQHMIKAAELQATLTQIDKYNAAANTFRAMCEGLPGDVSAQGANACGLQPRGQYAGEGDGNGVIEGVSANQPNSNAGLFQAGGETIMFWVDLSTAGLMDGAFSSGQTTTGCCNGITASTTPNIAAFLPAAKIGQGNYLNIWSGGVPSAGYLGGDGLNYFGLSAVTQLGGGWVLNSAPGLTVHQAFSIDTKIDDGLPQSGKVMAVYLNGNVQASNPVWAAGGGLEGANNLHLPTTAATPGSATTCYDNNNMVGPQQYSMAQNGGSGVNCALSFQFQ